MSRGAGRGRGDGALARLAAWCLPPRWTPPPGLAQLLAIVFPGLDPGRLDFRLGIPHLYRRLRPGAIALPDPLRPGRVRIHLGAVEWRPHRPPGLDLLCHETFHALQILELGPGRGAAHPFVALYAACRAGGCGYWNHPVERAAFARFGRPGGAFRRALAEAGADLPWHRLRPGEEPLDGDELERFRSVLAPFARRESGLDPAASLAACAPGPLRGRPRAARLLWGWPWRVVTAFLWPLEVALLSAGRLAWRVSGRGDAEQGGRKSG